MHRLGIALPLAQNRHIDIVAEVRNFHAFTVLALLFFNPLFKLQELLGLGTSRALFGLQCCQLVVVAAEVKGIDKVVQCI